MKRIVSAFILVTGVISAENTQNAPTGAKQPGIAVQNEAEMILKVTDHPKLGKILTDNKGMTLYFFTPDSKNASTCDEECANMWPPLIISNGKPKMAPGIVGTASIISRRDNSLQATYNGMPLYYYVLDKVPGDVNGQAIDNQWYVVPPKQESR